MGRCRVQSTIIVRPICAFEWLSQQDSTKSAFECWTQLTNIGIWPRERKLSTVTKPLNNLLCVMTDDSILFTPFSLWITHAIYTSDLDQLAAHLGLKFLVAVCVEC